MLLAAGNSRRGRVQSNLEQENKVVNIQHLLMLTKLIPLYYSLCIHLHSRQDTFSLISRMPTMTDMPTRERFWLLEHKGIIPENSEQEHALLYDALNLAQQQYIVIALQTTKIVSFSKHLILYAAVYHLVTIISVSLGKIQLSYAPPLNPLCQGWDSVRINLSIETIVNNYYY